MPLVLVSKVLNSFEFLISNVLFQCSYMCVVGKDFRQTFWLSLDAEARLRIFTLQTALV